MKQKLGYDKIGVIEKSNIYPSKWFFTVTYADLIDGVKVWRKYSNYVSETFKTKREATEQLNIKLTKTN